MRPINELPAEIARGLTGVFTDIDDTITTDGHLPAAAYAALERLQEAGLAVVPITGRPAGWCDMIARFWPVAGVVGENGAFTFRYDHAAKKMHRAFVASPEERVANRRKLEMLASRILAEVPGAAIASDQLYREADLAIDFCEDVPALPHAEIAHIVKIFEAHGAHAKVSSIHVNGWFGDYDKLTTSRLMMRELFGVDLEAARTRYVFSGDSPNDAPMFGFFPNAVGVANVRDFATDMDHLPRWITAARSGAGFVELARALIAARRQAA